MDFETLIERADEALANAEYIVSQNEELLEFLHSNDLFLDHVSQKIVGAGKDLLMRVGLEDPVEDAFLPNEGVESLSFLC